ncbi:MAG: cell division protein ZapA, partial [Cytophagales bacterium]|nr:cell division protein ZapA [Cytophagales bacterium]
AIRIKIGDREYPLKANAMEEERLRKAGKIINEKIKTFRDKFGIDNMQDLLAMVAFDCQVNTMKAEEQEVEDNQIITSRLNAIEHMMTSAVSE